MDQRRGHGQFRFRGPPPHKRWRGGGNSNQQYYPNQQRKYYRRNDYDNNWQSGDFGNNQFQPQQYNNQHSKSLTDFLLSESKLGKSSIKPLTEFTWSDEDQEEATKKKLSDVASKLKNKLKSMNEGGEQEDHKNQKFETENDFPMEDQTNIEEPPKRTAHIPKPFPPLPPVQPEVRRKSNEQREKPPEEFSSKIKTVQTNIQRKVIGELLSMPKSSLQMVLNDPKINPKIEMGMSNLVKENRLLLAQKFRNIAESKITNNEQFKDCQFVRDLENVIDTDLAVDLCRLPPEMIKQLGDMFQLNFDTACEGVTDNSANTGVDYSKMADGAFNMFGNPFINMTGNQFNTMESSINEPSVFGAMNDTLNNKNNFRENQRCVSSERALPNDPLNPSLERSISPERPSDNQPKYAKYLKKKTDEAKVESIPLPENDAMENVSIPLLSDLPQETLSSPVKNMTPTSTLMSPSPQKQISNVDEFDIYPWKERNVNLIMSPTSKSEPEMGMIASPVAVTSSPIALISSPVVNMASPGVAVTNLTACTASPIVSAASPVIASPRHSPSATVIKDTPISPVSKASSKPIMSPDISSNNDCSSADEDFLSRRDKDKNQNIKNKALPLSERLKVMQEVKAERIKSKVEIQSLSKLKLERSLKCKNFIEKLENKNSSKCNLVDKKSGDDSPARIEKWNQGVQVDIKKSEPVTLKTFENNLMDLVRSKKYPDELRKILNFHVTNLHGNCKKEAQMDNSFTQTEIKEFESNFSQTDKSPEKIYRRISIQTDPPAKTVKKPAETQTILKSSEVSNVYGVPIPILSAEESNENLINEIKMIDRVLHKLNERKFNIFLKLSGFNFLNDGEMSNSFLHTITNGDMNVWKHIFTKDPSTERKSSSSYSHKKPSGARSHSDSRHKEKSSSSHNKEKSSHEKKKEEKKEEKPQRRRSPSPKRRRSASPKRRRSPSPKRRSPSPKRRSPTPKPTSPAPQRQRTPSPVPVSQQQQARFPSPKPYKTKAELKSITNLAQLNVPLEKIVPKDKSFVKNWVESHSSAKDLDDADSDGENKKEPKARSEKDKRIEISEKKSEKIVLPRIPKKKNVANVANFAPERPVIQDLVQSAIELLEIDLKIGDQSKQEIAEEKPPRPRSSLGKESQPEQKPETPSETKPPAKKKRPLKKSKKSQIGDSKSDGSPSEVPAKKRKKKQAPAAEGETPVQAVKKVKKKKSPASVEIVDESETTEKPAKKRLRRVLTNSSAEAESLRKPRSRRNTKSSEREPHAEAEKDVALAANRLKSCSVVLERLNIPLDDNSNNSSDSKKSNSIPYKNNDESALNETKAEGDCDNINENNFDEDLPPDPGNQSPSPIEKPGNESSGLEEPPKGPENEAPEREEAPEEHEAERGQEKSPEPMEEETEINPQVEANNSGPTSTVQEILDEYNQDTVMDFEDAMSSDTMATESGGNPQIAARKENIFDSSVSDQSVHFLAVQNGDALSQNSESLQGGCPKKRKIHPISFQTHKGVVLDVKILGKHIFAACDDAIVYCYSIKSGKRKKEYSGHSGAVTSIAFLPGKKDYSESLLFTGSLDSHVRSFNIQNPKISKQSTTLPSEVQCLEQNWGVVYAGLKNGLIMRFNSKNLKAINPPLEVSQQSVLALKTMMEGPRKIIIVATRSNHVSIRDVTTGLLLRSVELNFTGCVYSLTYCLNQVYCGTSDSKLFSFDFTDGRITGEFESGPGVLSIKLVQNLIFTSSYDGKIYVFDSKTKERVADFPGPGKMLTAMDIYKNKQIVASSNDKKLETWAIPLHIRKLLKNSV